MAITRRSGSTAAADGAAPLAFTVMCIDDNTLLIDALERRLAMETGFERMYRVEDFAGAAAHVEATRPTVVLLDVDLPGGLDAMEILRDMGRRSPASRVIVFTGHATGELVTRAMNDGAWGFVSKGVPSDQLITAIRRVVSGEAAIVLED